MASIKKTVFNPFAHDRAHFASIPIHEREEYIAKILATPHAPGKPNLPPK